MVHVHVLLLCVLMGFAGVDLCFDSLILFDHLNCPIEKFHQVQQYYQRTRATYIVPLITTMIVVLAVSLVRCAVFRGWTKDYISLVAFLSLLPYYLFVMEPAEDACLGHNSASISEPELRDGLFKVGVGHILIIVIGTIMCLLDLEWKIESPKKKKI
jgi:hypothetical protein